MRILTALTYYRPHTSGLTIYAERLAKALVDRGHEVTILTMQYEKGLSRKEILDGVSIRRVPVAFRISKGCIAPTLGLEAWPLVLNHDVLHLHLPQFDAAGLAFRGRILRKPTIITYHCDIQMPPGFISQLASKTIHLMDDLAARFAHRVVTYTEDYRDNSPYLSRYRHKNEVILPPVVLPESTEGDLHSIKEKFNSTARAPVIGMAARFAAEKGVEVLLEAMPRILQVFPTVKVLFAGQYQNVWAESEYIGRLMPQIRTLQEQDAWAFTGTLSPQQMSAFFKNIDLLVVPSLNATESFGLVQIEAMLNHCPVVASDLPGVRQPVRMSGMGEIARIGDAESLAEAIIKVLSAKESYQKDISQLAAQFSPNFVAERYENLYRQVAEEIS